MKKEGKKKPERKKETSAKYKRPNCYFCLWLVDYSASIQANHKPWVMEKRRNIRLFLGSIKVINSTV